MEYVSAEDAQAVIAYDAAARRHTDGGVMAGRDDVLDEMRHSFQIAAGALLLIFATVAALIVGQAHRAHWTTHAREVARLARDIRALAVDRETALRGYLLSGMRVSLQPDVEARRRLPLALDSLVDATADDDAQHARAVQLKRSLERWDREFASPILAAPSVVSRAPPVSYDSLTGKSLFDQFRSTHAELLGVEDELYRRRANSERTVRIAALSALVAELLIVGVLLRRFRRRVVRQTYRILMQRDELTVQSERVSLKNKELTHLNNELQEQAVLLEEQQAELEVTLDELRESEERFRTLLSSMSDMVYTLDLEGRFDGLLGQWVEREQIDPARILGRTAIDIFGEEHGAVHRVASERALRGEQVTYDWHTRPGPEQRFFTSALSPLRDAKGRIIGAVGIGRDITERRRKEEELSNAQERLRHAQKLEAVGQLAGGIAHDFNNVLTVITAYSDMMVMEIETTHPLHEPIVEIRQAAGRAAALTKQLLAFSRRQQLHPQPVDLNEVIHGVENLISRLLGPEHQFLVQLSPDIDAVLADRGQLEQVLMNLAANARDAMQRPGRFSITTGRVLLDSQAARSLGMPAGLYVALSARDTGTGMSPETQARLFEPFFTTKDIGKGTGLGLATVHGIVEQSRGHIRVESQPGQGATFTVYLPSIRAQLTPSSLPIIPAASTVLLVDDEPAVRAATSKLLRESGYEVVEAANAEEALQMLRLDPVRVGMLLTDMVMPGMSGRDLAQVVRREFPRVAVAIMSGFIRESLLQDPALRTGIAFVEKPFTLFSLTNALREASSAIAGK